MEILMVDFDNPAYNKLRDEIGEIGEVKKANTHTIIRTPEKINSFGLFIPSHIINAVYGLFDNLCKDLMIFTENEKGNLKCLGKIADLVVG